MRRLLSLLMVVAFSTTCSSVCLTVFDECRQVDTVTYPPRPDAAMSIPDAGMLADAGFLACVSMGCEDECGAVPDYRFVCMFPQCVGCQLAASDAGRAVFCGREFICGRDASADLIDASMSAVDAALPDASDPTDGGEADGG